jgi:hypothetical protein
MLRHDRPDKVFSFSPGSGPAAKVAEEAIKETDNPIYNSALKIKFNMDSPDSVF